MARTNKADLERLARIIIRHTGNEGYYIEYAYGRPRLLLQLGPTKGEKEVSPRLPARELALWLDGFIEAFRVTEKNPHVPTDVLAMNPKKLHGAPLPCADDLTVEVWEERDRLNIAVLDPEQSEALVSWWDDDARSMFEDGFFKSGRELKQSVIDYVVEMGWATWDCEEDDDDN